MRRVGPLGFLFSSQPECTAHHEYKKYTSAHKRRQIEAFWIEHISKNHGCQGYVRAVYRDLLENLKLFFVHRVRKIPRIPGDFDKSPQAVRRESHRSVHRFGR